MSAHACGRCSGELEQAEFGGVPFESCTGCQGVLVAQPKLVRLLDRLCDTLGEHIAAEGAIPPVPDDGGVVHCPSCAAAMERFGYMETRTVYLDKCRKCALVWVDRQEMQTTVIMHARVTQRCDAHKTMLDELAQHLTRLVVRNHR